MQMPDVLDPNLLAPCGMNCLVCYVFLREKKPCRGCRAMDDSQPDHCRVCKIKTCAAEREVVYCSDCPDFPCTVIKRLDRSYRQRYAVNLVEDARQRQALGVDAYLLEEKMRWTCAACGGVVSLHDRVCSQCGARGEKVVT